MLFDGYYAKFMQNLSELAYYFNTSTAHSTEKLDR